MNVDEVTACHAMLVAQWPSLGGDDELGDVRVTAWFHALRPWKPEVAFATTERLIQSWSGTFPPRIAEWIMAARATAERLAPRALPDIAVAPEERVTTDFLGALLAPVRVGLQDAAQRKRMARTPPKRPVPEHQDGEMLSYDEVYAEAPDGDG
jgi:hypothetical protein